MINCDQMHTQRYGNIAELVLEPGAVYLYHKGIEERSMPAADPIWEQMSGATFIDVNLKDAVNDVAEVVQSHEFFSLRSESQMLEVFAKNDPAAIYIDSSGMSVRVLAPLLKMAIKWSSLKNISVYVVYVEPCEYDVKKFEEGGRFYNLAEGFNGLSPLPTLSSILPVRGKTGLIPMLGFEGGRFAHILNQLSSEDDTIIPIIGVAGYRPEYPFVTYCGNRHTLEETESWANVKYAMAGSVVDAFSELMRIKNEYHDIRHWKIAPIGTKPHAIAALLFAILNPLCAEIVYDNPTRKKSRTQGVGCVSVTCISDLIEMYGNA